MSSMSGSTERGGNAPEQLPAPAFESAEEKQIQTAESSFKATGTTLNELQGIDSADLPPDAAAELSKLQAEAQGAMAAYEAKLAEVKAAQAKLVEQTTPAESQAEKSVDTTSSETPKAEAVSVEGSTEAPVDSVIAEESPAIAPEAAVEQSPNQPAVNKALDTFGERFTDESLKSVAGDENVSAKFGAFIESLKTLPDASLVGLLKGADSNLEYTQEDVTALRSSMIKAAEAGRSRLEAIQNPPEVSEDVATEEVESIETPVETNASEDDKALEEAKTVKLNIELVQLSSAYNRTTKGEYTTEADNEKFLKIIKESSPEAKAVFIAEKTSDTALDDVLNQFFDKDGNPFPQKSGLDQLNKTRQLIGAEPLTEEDFAQAKRDAVMSRIENHMDSSESKYDRRLQQVGTLGFSEEQKEEVVNKMKTKALEMINIHLIDALEGFGRQLYDYTYWPVQRKDLIDSSTRALKKSLSSLMAFASKLDGSGVGFQETFNNWANGSDLPEMFNNHTETIARVQKYRKQVIDAITK